MHFLISIAILFVGSNLLFSTYADPGFFTILGIIIFLVGVLYLSASIVEYSNDDMKKWHRITPGRATKMDEGEWDDLGDSAQARAAAGRLAAAAHKAGMESQDIVAAFSPDDEVAQQQPARSKKQVIFRAADLAAPEQAAKPVLPSDSEGVRESKRESKGEGASESGSASKADEVIFYDSGFDHDVSMPAGGNPSAAAPEDGEDRFDDIFGVRENIPKE